MTSLPSPSPRKLGLVIDLDTCVGCHACAVACKEWNDGGDFGTLPDADPYGAEPHGVWFNRVHSYAVEPGIGNRESGIGKAEPAATHTTDSPFPIPDSPRLHRCLSILPGQVRRLPESPGVRIPHMGWNALIPRRAHPLVAGLSERDYAYFVHSFAVAESELTLMACQHGATFSAIVARGNFMGAQFHPERSAAVGARLLANFLTLDAEALS